LIISLAGVLKYLDFLYFCSYVKLFITLIKYVPQAYLNFRRKSTFGWSIGNILLDFTGGFLSIGQMFVISYNESKFFINWQLPTNLNHDISYTKTLCYYIAIAKNRSLFSDRFCWTFQEPSIFYWKILH
jgi:hypothetical protein